MERKRLFIINFLYIVAIIITVRFSVKYLLSPLMPFIIAFLIVSVSEELISKLTFGIFSKKTASIIFTFLVVILLAVILYSILSGIYSEILRLYSDFDGSFIERIRIKYQEMFSTFDKNSLVGRKVYNLILKLSDKGAVLDRLSQNLLPKAASFFMKFLLFFPSAILFIFVLFLSLFYIGYDYDKICNFIFLQMSENLKDTLNETKRIIFSTVKELFKAYFLLTFITFIQLLIGFFILDIDFAFILASIICFVDLLPILGTGTILFPWSAISFLLGDLKTAIGLLVLYAVISIFRQVAEPKIVGANIGLSPLLSLVSIFLGLKLMGFWGIIVFPIIFITIIRLNEKGLIKLYTNFPEKEKDRIGKTRRKFLDFKRNDINH